MKNNVGNAMFINNNGQKTEYIDINLHKNIFSLCVFIKYLCINIKNNYLLPDCLCCCGYQFNDKIIFIVKELLKLISQKKNIISISYVKLFISV